MLKNHQDNQQTALFRATTSLERIPLNLLNNIHKLTLQSDASMS